MDVIVYTTPTCPWCTRVKEYLDQKGVQYREVNVKSNGKENACLQSWSTFVGDSGELFALSAQCQRTDIYIRA